MDNFIIKNTTDFNKYLMQLISEENEGENENETKTCLNDLCLITNEKLKEKYYTMSCGHKFNYIPLIKEFINQKFNTSHYEVTSLSKFDLKCPYCRNIQRGTIPYYSSLYSDKIIGINWPPSKLSLNNYCKAVFKTGKRKGDVCNTKCLHNYCKRHNRERKIPSENTTLCIKILKSGKRKGEKCNCKCNTPDSIQNKLCKRHLKM